MSDDDYSGDDLDFGWEHDYAYIDESYDLADELAERTCPSPPPYTEEELEDYDPFDYFHEVEDGTAGYFDVNWPAQSSESQTETVQTGQKRKAMSTPSPRRKKQVGKNRTGVIIRQRLKSPTPMVLWRSQDARQKMAHSATRPFVAGLAKPYALLKDWRNQLGNTIKNTKEDMESEPDSSSGASDSNGDGKSSIDAAALQAALQAHLTSANPVLLGLDNSMILQYALGMLNGQDADGLVDELTENLLGGRPDDGDSVQEDDSEHEAMDMAQDLDEPLPIQVIQKGQDNQSMEKVASAQDETILPNDAPSAAYSKTTANTRKGTTSPSRRYKTGMDISKPDKTCPPTKAPGRKRKAATPQLDDAGPSSKRKAPSYAAPTATSKARTKRG